MRAELGHRLAASVGPAYVTDAAAARAAMQIADDIDAFVVTPATAAEIAEVVRLARLSGVGLVVIGTGTRSPVIEPVRAEPLVVVSMGRMVQVLRLDETSLTVQVQAGITGAALETLLVRRGLTLGDLPPVALRSSLGGAISVRTPGKLSAHHGALDDALIGLSAVLLDGRIVHTRIVPRRAAGPDPARALVGAEGKLGFIADVVLRVHRRAEARVLGAWSLPTLADAIAVVRAGLRADVAPAAVRIVGGQLVAAFSGPGQLVQTERGIIDDLVRERGGQDLAPDVAEAWWHEREHPPAPSPSRSPAEIELWAPAARLVAAATALAATAPAKLTVSRIDADGGCLHVTPACEGAEALAHLIDLARAHHARTAGQPEPALAPYLDAMRTALDPPQGQGRRS